MEGYGIDGKKKCSRRSVRKVTVGGSWEVCRLFFFGKYIDFFRYDVYTEYIEKNRCEVKWLSIMQKVWIGSEWQRRSENGREMVSGH